VEVSEGEEMEAIGLIGVGLMGSAMASRFTAGGFEVIGFDIDPARRMGADSAADVIRACRYIVLSLPASPVSQVVLEETPPTAGTIVIDTTTGEPDQMAAIGARLAERGVDYLDATVSGSSRLLANGEATVMAGGRREAFDACTHLFRCFARKAFYLGPCGSGARMKLVVNLALGLNRAVLAEALNFARAYRVDPATALEVLKSGASYSRAMDAKGGKMLARDYSVEARLAQHLKDVDLILEAARSCGAQTPLSAIHRRLLEKAVEAGYGDADNSAIIEAFRPPVGEETAGA
jgi:3-hydroxyisobutyrate dehydrogenase-like beta-hydroxyacid dehydrogenase